MRRDDDGFDREIDVALARYAAEPRAGLEQRVLANLRAAERERDVARGWWRPTLGALAAAILITAISLIWRPASKAPIGATTSGAAPEEVANSSRTAIAAPSDLEKPRLQIGRSQERVRSSGHTTSTLVSPRAAQELPRTETAHDIAPRLEQFPAPEPLSEQEKLLVRFVQEDPSEAALVAQARTERLQREEDEMKALRSGEDSEQQQR